MPFELVFPFNLKIIGFVVLNSLTKNYRSNFVVLFVGTDPNISLLIAKCTSLILKEHLVGKVGIEPTWPKAHCFTDS